ncbi:MAG: Carbamate kinase 1 [candidate division TA06 bacterium ADurb.Bin417]|uniref:Carbamate kinase n=1 Tax=candidate division TA06 bacterium ADurb.Bin417 TaxID=1852828 RepID=A0A1V5M7X1_UNCT6|nr:MAG: Carbamate kinase 1 [candidate division TA06 bacterium ADurb.Bin417]
MNARKTAVIAIGGNSLIRNGQRVDAESQYQAARETCLHIADLIRQGWEVAIGHGNGPQVGFNLRRSEIAARTEGMYEVPLDVCGADSQGFIGYTLQQNLQNILSAEGIDKKVATVITQVRVDREDRAFQNPTKPIGSFMDAAEAERRRKELNWTVVEDSGRGFRRVVASPEPRKILELETIRTLLDAGIVTITVGGGGIPVTDSGDGGHRGIAAVIDKDLSSSLLARAIGAELFIISTAVEKVALRFGKPDQRWLDRMTLKEAEDYLAQGGHFASGSMAPKIQAVIAYLREIPRGRALITNPENLDRAMRGETGTWIVRD